MPIEIVTCGGELAVEGETLHRTGFCVVSDLNTLAIPQLAASENIVIPGIPGRVGATIAVDQGTHTLECVLVGDVSCADGSPFDDPEEGFEVNLDWVVSTILSPPDWETDPDSGRDFTWERPSGTTKTGRCQMTNFQLGEMGRGLDQWSNPTVGALCTLDMIVLGGVPT